MANGGPFAGGGLIRAGFERFGNRDEREEAERRRELLNRLREQRIRESEARFRRGFDYRPQGASDPVEDRPVSRAGGAEGTAASGFPGPEDRKTLFERERRRQTQGKASAATEGGTAPSVAEGVKSLRTEGGTELVPGDVREREAMDRVLSQAPRVPDTDRLRQASVPYASMDDRLALPEDVGGGTISRTPPEVRRRRERMQRLEETLGQAFPEEDQARIRLAAMTGDTGFLGRDPERAHDRMAETVANVWMSSGPQTSAREIAEQTGAPIEVIGMARDRIETAEPTFFPDPDAGQEGADEDTPFLNTGEGQQAFTLFRENLDRDPTEVANTVGTDNLQGVLDARERVRELQEATEGAEDMPPAPSWDQAWEFVKETFGSQDFRGNVTFPDAVERDELMSLTTMLAEGDTAARARVMDLKRRIESAEHEGGEQPKVAITEDAILGPNWKWLPWVPSDGEDTGGGGDSSGGSGGSGGGGQSFEPATRTKGDRLINHFDGSVTQAVSWLEDQRQRAESEEGAVWSDQDARILKYLKSKSGGGQ